MFGVVERRLTIPEGPEVRIVADVMLMGVGKKFLTSQIVENMPGIRHRFSRDGVPRFKEIQLPWILKTVNAKGKLIYFDIEAESGPVVGLLTLGMSGSLMWGSKTHKHARLAFIPENGPELVFIDVRNFGTFRLKSPAEVDILLDKIGWDLLQAPAPENLWASFQKMTRIKNKPIGEVLLNQEFWAGVGNIYKSESMYLTKIDPRFLVKDIPIDKWMKINYVAHQIMKDSYQKGGSSVESFLADGKEGSYQLFLKVYGKRQCPEGHSITNFKQGERTTWMCEPCLQS